MTRARTLTAAGTIHLGIALLLTLTSFSDLPVTALGSGLGFTPTPTESPPIETPTSPPPPSTPTAPPSTKTPAPPSPKPSPHVTISKTANPTQLSPGDQISFRIDVCNDGDAVAENVVVSDALPPELELLSASASQGTVVTEGNAVRAELGSIHPGHCAQIIIVARVRSDVPPGTQIRNVASVNSLYDDATVTVTALLPESGRSIPRLLIAALVAVSGSLLAAGLALKARSSH